MNDRLLTNPPRPEVAADWYERYVVTPAFLLVALVGLVALVWVLRRWLRSRKEAQ